MIIVKLTDPLHANEHLSPRKAYSKLMPESQNFADFISSSWTLLNINF